MDFTCECSKVCKSKGGLTLHKRACKFISAKAKLDKTDIIVSIEKNYSSTDDLELIKLAEQDGLILAGLGSKTAKNFNIVMAAVKQNGMALEFAHKDMCNNEQIVMAAVLQNPEALKYACPLTMDNKKIILCAVAGDGKLLRYASKRLQGDMEVVTTAINQNVIAFRFASYDMKDNKKIAFMVLEKNPKFIEELPENIIFDREIILFIAPNYPNVMELLFSEDIESDEEGSEHSDDGEDPREKIRIIKSDREIAKIVLSKNSNNLPFFDNSIKSDYEMIRIAFYNNPSSLTVAHKEIRSDKPFLLTLKMDWKSYMTAKNILSSRFAEILNHTPFKGDKEIEFYSFCSGRTTIRSMKFDIHFYYK